MMHWFEDTIEISSLGTAWPHSNGQVCSKTRFMHRSEENTCFINTWAKLNTLYYWFYKYTQTDSGVNQPKELYFCYRKSHALYSIYTIFFPHLIMTLLREPLLAILFCVLRTSLNFCLCSFSLLPASAEGQASWVKGNHKWLMET